MPNAQIKIITDSRVKAKFDSYPKSIRKKIHALRMLIIECAEECDHISELEETLKWGEPSYIAKKGSTIRIDWKPKKPDQYAIYFKCTSKLVVTFREVFGDVFNYESNRAIVFSLEDSIPKAELKACIGSALNYHILKKEERLGL